VHALLEQLKGLGVLRHRHLLWGAGLLTYQCRLTITKTMNNTSRIT
jgi:hypothetical protein